MEPGYNCGDILPCILNRELDFDLARWWIVVVVVVVVLVSLVNKCDVFAAALEVGSRASDCYPRDTEW